MLLQTVWHVNEFTLLAFLPQNILLCWKAVAPRGQVHQTIWERGGTYQNNIYIYHI